jgi:mannitol-1-phosphate/altronate dehydrogenase
MREQAATVASDYIAADEVVSSQTKVKERFANPFIKDALWRIGQDGSLKLQTTMGMSALQNAREGRSIACFACAFACWARFMVGVDESGDPIEVIIDPRAAALTVLARAVFQCAECGTMAVEAPCHAIMVPKEDRKDVAELLRAVFGEEYAGDGAIVEAVFKALSELATTSTRHLMQGLAGSE